MKHTARILLTFLVFSAVVSAEEIIVGPGGGPASSYPYCGS